MTVPFRQPIREGQSGSDVKAVKRATIAMHIGGSGSMVTRGPHADFAGESFIKVVKRVQKNHSLHQDGVYGKVTHEIVAPHFDAYGRQLYRRATIRKPKCTSGMPRSGPIRTPKRRQTLKTANASTIRSLSSCAR